MLKIDVYKGFGTEFLKNLDYEALSNSEVLAKLDIFKFDNKYRDDLFLNIICKKGNYWMTYEEFWSVKEELYKRVDGEYELELEIIHNNAYPDNYKCDYIQVNDELIRYINEQNSDSINEIKNDKLMEYEKYYSNICVSENNIVYISFYKNDNTKIKEIEYYKGKVDICSNCDIEEVNYNISITSDIIDYLFKLEKMTLDKNSVININNQINEINSQLFECLRVYLYQYGITQVYNKLETIVEESFYKHDLLEIAKNDLIIPNFNNFRQSKFYTNPYLNNDTEYISQDVIMSNIIEQSVNALTDKDYRDVFVTATTGAGKSLLFQLPAIYLAKKYKTITIIIVPIKELMLDQVNNMKKRGYSNVAYINGDLTLNEKQAILEQIEKGDVSILFLSPETLLSYSINSIIGDKKIGLMIIDEAHIVTTWGVGFRPDYWYLGEYINRIRKKTKSNPTNYNFPICTFTATAVLGGIDDTVLEMISSLYMNDPIKYLGEVRRDNIKFSIFLHESINSKSEYDQKKSELIQQRIKKWDANKEKTIVYFPYSNTAHKAFNCEDSFNNLQPFRNKFGLCTGSTNVYLKKEMIDKFKNNERLIMFSTKAFGMGIDIDDILNVYHYAFSGNLSDYVQEIGRVARKKDAVGYAVVDYIDKDCNFSKALFGMSSIRTYQILGVLRIIYNTYRIKNKRNIMISAKKFESVFPNQNNESSLEAKLKIALLMLEKDFYDKYHYKVVIARPRSVFSTGYVCVVDNMLNMLKRSKFYKYFKFIAEKRVDFEVEPGYLVSDEGDIYALNLKEMWEENFSKMSFPAFKREFYDNQVKIFGNKLAGAVKPRQKITVNLVQLKEFSLLPQLINHEIEFICEQLNLLKNKGGYFSIKEFENLLQTRYGKTIKSKLLAENLFSLIDPKRKSIKSRKNNQEEYEYIIANGGYADFFKTKVLKNDLFKRIIRCNDSKYLAYINTHMNSKENKYNFNMLNILVLFEFVTFDTIGGDSPEIFIRLNDPIKISNILNNQMYYKNNYVENAIKRHDYSIKVMDHFFRELHNDSERWDFIEKYFLGEQVI